MKNKQTGSFYNASNSHPDDIDERKLKPMSINEYEKQCGISDEAKCPTCGGKRGCEYYVGEEICPECNGTGINPDCQAHPADNNLKVKFIRENSQLLGLKLSARDLDKKYIEWLETECLLMKAEKEK